MILMYGFLRIARSVAIVGLDRREFIRFDHGSQRQRQSL